MRPARLLQLLKLLVGAVVLGVATLFQPKVRPDDHWSTSPAVDVVDETAGGAVGGGP